MIVIDTNILVAFAKEEEDKDLKAVERLFLSMKEGNVKSFMPSIVISEIFAIFFKSNELRKAIELLIYTKELNTSIVDLNEELAKSAGIIKAKYGTSYGDAIVACTASEKGAVVITYDPQFSSIKDVKSMKPEEFLKRS